MSAQRSSSPRLPSPAPQLPLSGADKRRLRGAAHDLDPVVQLGQRGLTDGLVAEVDRALTAHGLIKVRLAGSRVDKDADVGQLEARLGAATVQRIGHLVVLYRPRPEAPTPE